MNMVYTMTDEELANALSVSYSNRNDFLKELNKRGYVVKTAIVDNFNRPTSLLPVLALPSKVVAITKTIEVSI